MRNVLIFLSFITIASCSRKASPLLVGEDISIINIKIDESGSIPFGPCEPSITINPSNTNHIVAGAILDNVYVSNDAGKTWSKDKMKSPFGVYGDPVVRSDYKGNVYYAHLSNPTGRAYVDKEFLDRIVVQKSEDGGKTWNGGRHPSVRGEKDQDKEWLHVDPASNIILMSWTEFDKYGSKDPSDRSRILFSKSEDMGETWSDPIAISQIEGDCIDSDNTTEGAVPTMLEDGTILVTWSMGSKIYLDRSIDGGKTWLDNDILVADHFGGWDIKVPGFGRVNGMPVLEVDLSDGPNSGNLYINWSDQRNGEEDTDIWLVRSTDQGTTWSEPIRVNDDPPGKHQFFSWMDIDPKTGYIYIVFYDRRNHPHLNTDVYLAYSTDGGQSFINRKISETPFAPNPNVFFGDYNDIAAYDGKVRPIWTRLDDYKLSVWTAIIDVNK